MEKEHVYEEFLIAGYYIQIWEISQSVDLPYYKVRLSYDNSSFCKPQSFENPGAARLAAYAAEYQKFADKLIEPMKGLNSES